ncbi:MAG: class I SAM-dependent methyltransferase [Rhodomicrobium sp.]
MSASNSETLRSYSERVHEYIEGTSKTLPGGTKDWIDAALVKLTPEAKIIELGSAFGRDAAYIAAKGFDVECSDAVEGFVSHLRTLGFKARLYNALTDELEQTYDLILANAVFHHFDRAEFALVLKKLRYSLNKGGHIAFSLKRGTGEVWSTEKIGAPRYFCYWEKQELEPILADATYAQWTIVETATERTHAEWLYIIAQG